jgi:hypothetical protein
MSSDAPSDCTDVLRACLRMRHDANQREALARIAAELTASHPALLAAIEEQRVGPLLHRVLGNQPFVSREFAEALDNSYHRSAICNLLLLRELGAVLQALAARNIAVIVLKGAALADAVYGNLALRPMGDVDLLVAQRDMAPTRLALEQLGYSVARVETHPGVLVEQENEVAFLKPGRIDAWMDVHWSLFDSPYYQSRMAMDWFWDSADHLTLGDQPALVLGTEALLIHLCGHLALHHEGLGLLWWQDIVEVLHRRGDQIDWATLLRKTRELQLLPPVRSVLTRAADEWGAPVPADVLAALREPSDSPRAERLYEQLSVARSPGQRFLTDLSSTSGWRQRLRYARTNLFPSAAYMRERYSISHPLLVPLYYPYRWLRGVLGLR